MNDDLPTLGETDPITVTPPASSFGPLFFFCAGALIAKLSAGLLPPLFENIFDIAVYAGIAYSVALSYRRFVRRTIETRRRERARREGRGER